MIDKKIYVSSINKKKNLKFHEFFSQQTILHRLNIKHFYLLIKTKIYIYIHPTTDTHSRFQWTTALSSEKANCKIL